MYQDEMQLLVNKKKKWFNILMHFGCHPDHCEDIIQDMYLKVFSKLNQGADIKYKNGSINYFYIFKILRSLYIDIKRKEKNIVFIEIDLLYKMESHEFNTDLYLKIENELKRMYWYDRKVFEIINEGESIRKLSKKTGISYHSLYNTFKKVKNKIKKMI